MKYLIVLIFTFYFSAMSSTLAESKKRFALLIGNKNYKLSELNLKNPHNDVDLIAKSLKKIGFEVTVVKDAKFAKLMIETRRYADKLRRAGKKAVGFFYYSGHGAMDQSTGINYLIPVGVSNVNSVKLWHESVQLDEVIRTLNNGASNAIHIVVFDACRNELRLKKDGTKSLFGTKGFRPTKQYSRMLISYATAAGETASDNGEQSGIYAQILSAEIIKPGLEITAAFRNVQLGVSQKINQEPWLKYNSLPATYLNGTEAADVLEWKKVKNSQSVKKLASFVEAFPKSPYSELANHKIKNLNQEEKKTEDKQTEPERSAADTEWGTLRDSTNKEKLLSFATRFDKTPYAELARQRIIQLKRDEQFRLLSSRPVSNACKTASQAYKKIQKQNSCETLKTYAKKHSACTNWAELARARIADLKCNEYTIVTQVQAALRRTGCYRGHVDGKWGRGSTLALKNFFQQIGKKPYTTTPTSIVLNTLKKHNKIVCKSPERKVVKVTTPEVERKVTPKTPQGANPFDGVWRGVKTGCRQGDPVFYLNIKRGIVRTGSGGQGRISKEGYMRLRGGLSGKSITGRLKGNYGVIAPNNNKCQIALTRVR